MRKVLPCLNVIMCIEHKNKPILQIPQCIRRIYHNASFCNRNVHISVTKWCIVGNGTGALWDLCNGSIKEWAGRFYPALRLEHNGPQYVEDICKCIFTKEIFCILVIISLKCVTKDPVENNSALVQMIYWMQTMHNPLPVTNDVQVLLLYMHYRSQWVKSDTQVI